MTTAPIGICIDCGAEFDARRRNGARPRRCLACAERWCTRQAAARHVTDEDVSRLRAALIERNTTEYCARELGVPVRSFRNLERRALRAFVAGMRRAAS